MIRVPCVAIAVKKACDAANASLLTGCVATFGLLAGDVKQSRNDNPTGDLVMAADPTRHHPLCGPWYLRYCLSLRDVEEMLEYAISMSITQRPGGECRITALRRSSDCEGI
jgi:hypothetical protein